MTPLKALLIGIIQGICEFFPISSSAHLRIFDHFFNFHIQEFLLLEAICNLGTALAVIIALRNEIRSLFFEKKETLIHIFLTIIPLVPFYLIFKYINLPTPFLGFCLILTSILLFLSIFVFKESTNSSNRKIKDVLFMGTVQSFALIPGISRSGIMIFAGSYKGWKIKETITFSYLVYVFLILGGNGMEFLKVMIKKETVHLDINCFFIAFISSFLVGLACVRFILSIDNKKKLLPFAWYTLIVGIFCLIYFNLS